MLSRQSLVKTAILSTQSVGFSQVNFSGPHVPYAPPDTNLVDRIRYWSQQRPTDIAMYYTSDGEDEARITYAQLDEQSRAIAAQLISLGMTGQRALLLFPPDWIS